MPACRYQSAMTARRVVLCADDFGLSTGVNRGILELLEKDRLSATSCMVNYPEFARDGRALRAFMGRADLGLHFSLTDSRSLPSVALEYHLRPPPLSAVIGIVERQLEKFVDTMGILPDHIDGHQHVHVLPIVRDAVIHIAKRIGAYVRVTIEPIDAAMWGRPGRFESFYLARASRQLRKLALQVGVATNRGFRGVRTFREKDRYRALFRKMIGGAGEGCLIMCHPGHIDELLARRDRLIAPRSDEWAYFSGPDFPADLAEAELELSRLRDANPAAMMVDPFLG
jgi:chitin disaccharide deacetylase